MLNTRPARPFSSVTDIIGTLLLPFILALSLVPALVLAGNTGAESRAEALTHSLLALNARYNHAKPGAQRELLEQLIETVAARQQVIEELLQTNTPGILKFAIPQGVHDKLPEVVQTMVEQTVETQGELEALYEDYEDGSHKLKHFLRASGKRYALHFESSSSQIRPGRTVHVRGLLLGNTSSTDKSGTDGTLIVPADEEGIHYLAADGSGSTDEPSASMAALTHTIGEQRTLVLQVNFLDTASELPFSPAQTQQAVFGSVSNFYHEASYGKTWLTGEVHGWYTLPINSTCTTFEVSEAADALASEDGVDLTRFDRIIYVMKGAASCFWTGASNMGVLPSRAWLNGNINPMIIAHELGHGFGLHHSGFLECGDTILGPDCTKTQDDKFDTMGSAPEPAHFNAFQKDRLGWYQPGDVLDVTADGTYSLAPFESQYSSQPKTLKIQNGVDPLTGSTSWYYLEYRQPLGTDAFLADNWNVTHGILIHEGQDSDGSTSWLLDMTPSSQLLTFYDRSDPALTAGESFTDSAAGITITTTSTDQNQATVNVSLGQALCSAGIPLVSIAPATRDAAAGTTVNYDLSVTNQDTAECTQSTFTLNNGIPAGWTGSFSQATLSLMPGETGSTTFSVTSASSAAAGTYIATVNVNDPGETTHTATANTSYTVVEACAGAIPDLSLSPATQSSDPGATLVYTVSLANNDNASCGTTDFDLTLTSLPGGWSSDLSPTSMSLLPGATGVATLSVTSDPAAAGSYNLHIGVSDPLDPVHAKTATAIYVVNDTTPADDTQAPSTPTGLAASETNKQVNLTWNSSSDNVGVAGYQVWRNGAVIAGTTDSAYTDRDLADNVQYEYNIEAYDAAYNVSGLSDPVMAGKAKAKGKGSGGGKGKGNNK